MLDILYLTKILFLFEKTLFYSNVFENKVMLFVKYLSKIKYD